MAIGDPLTSKSQLYGRDSVDLLARTLWGETRGDSDSRVSVAYVINNRKNNTTYGEFKNLNTIEAVVLKPFAFSCFNEGNPNLPECLAPNRSSAVWTNIVNLASNLGNYTNEIGSKCFYSTNTRFAELSYTSGGKLYYSFPGGGTVQVSSKVVVGKHTFFDYVV
ncbi:MULTISPECIES: cell wall hydrolase [Paenibacillus]|uniref:Spore germination cell wall hydrolase CwlJ-like protein n=1 Tax=Paenibacillus silagei TaxID=1670801 RepID=A0ABS4NWN3_9BACL|nr:cell wall hydrolase [Paenibacillus silagei]MBP2113886.1 spore germination cell wall hydrolase CwlJ-like protein [Paenibacillus silagei]